MRIIDHRTLAAMPAGTVYAELPSTHISGLGICVKTSADFSVPNDWVYVSFDTIEMIRDSGDVVDRIEEMRADPTVSYPMQVSAGRDGSYADETQYLLYEQADVDNLVLFLTGKWDEVEDPYD